MIIDPRRYSRGSLSEEQLDFLTKIVSFARLVQTTTLDKCELLRIPSEIGFSASLFIAHTIESSKWYTDNISIKESNLWLLEVNDYWKGKSVNYEGTQYKSYPSWLDFSLDLTDEFSFFSKHIYLPILSAKTLDSQLIEMSKLQSQPTIYHDRMREIIKLYGLWEFDF